MSEGRKFRSDWPFLSIMSRIERKCCLISISCLPAYLTFSYYFIFDRIACILVAFYQWGHLVMLIIRKLNLISVQAWTYLDWLRQRAFFLNHEGTFGNREGMITSSRCWWVEHSCNVSWFPSSNGFKKEFQKRIASEFALNAVVSSQSERKLTCSN